MLNILSKVLEQIAHKQLSDYLEENNMLCKQQYGFRRNRSTQAAVTYLTEHIRQNMDNSCCTGALYINLKKGV